MSSDVPRAAQIIAEHVVTQLEQHRAHRSTPLIVGVQGPQGSGKTFLTAHVQSLLSNKSISCAVLSIDDFYLPHKGLVGLAERYPDSALLKGRGQPGTHDVRLAVRVLRALREGEEVSVPVFDKSLHDGEGDRLPEGRKVHGPPDVILLEGWCVGFAPVDSGMITSRLSTPVEGLDFDIGSLQKADIERVNDFLEIYARDWWSLIDIFIQIKPPDTHPYAYIYTWRTQQEHAMKARNGGRGMSDEQVKKFVDRYIPGYVFFSDGVSKGPWTANSLRIVIDQNREVIDSVPF